MTREIHKSLLLFCCWFAFSGCRTGTHMQSAISMVESKDHPSASQVSSSRPHPPKEIQKANPQIDEYDAALITKVENQWFQLLDERNYIAERTGTVVLSFTLNADGSVSDLRFVENTGDLALGLLCQSALKSGAPYPRWPEEKRQRIGTEHHTMELRFNYR
jgi:TonB family protein